MITGIFGGVASLVFNLFVISVGASGAVFGLYGYYIVNELLVNYRDRSALINIVISFAVFVVINYFVAISMPVDTAAHLGVFVSGAILAIIGRFRRRYLSPVLLSVILLSAASTLLVLPKDQVQYYAIFQQVIDTEDHQGKLYDRRLPDQQL